MKPGNLILIGAAGVILYNLLKKKASAETSEPPASTVDETATQQEVIHEYNQYNEYNEYNTYEQAAPGQPVIVAPATDQTNTKPAPTQPVYVAPTQSAPANYPSQGYTAPPTSSVKTETRDISPNIAPATPTVIPRTTTQPSATIVENSVRGVDGTERCILLRPALNGATPAHAANSRIYIRDLSKIRVFSDIRNSLYHLHPEYGFNRVSM